MIKMLMSFLSGVYGLCVKCCQASYRRLPFRIKKVNARVISIGNITWGGTGKTPLVIWLAASLIESGKKVAVLTRGYGQDEVEEFKKRIPQVPLLVGRDRIKMAREAVLRHQSEILILDDGFQHIRLHRDLDVVNINTTQPFGPGGLIPLGTLREPLENLSRADIFVLTKSNIGAKNLHWIRQRIQAIKPNAIVFEAIHRPVQLADWRRNRFLPLTELKGKKVAAISGIGDPFSFEKTVENCDAQIVLAARFDDHHRYQWQELLDFFQRCNAAGAKDIVTTEKDYQRIEAVLKNRREPEVHAAHFLVLQIDFEIHDEEDFIRRCVNS